jgi:hypothetical protein
VIAGLKRAKNGRGGILGPSQTHLASSFAEIWPACREQTAEHAVAEAIHSGAARILKTGIIDAGYKISNGRRF